LARAFSSTALASTTAAWVRDATLVLHDFDLEQMVVETPEKRLSVVADSIGHIWTLAAGGGGAVAAGGDSDSKSGSFALSLAGSVSINSIGGRTRARLIDTTVTFETSDADLTSAEIDPVHPWPADFSSNARVRATDGSDIVAIAGALAFALANGGSGKATAVAFGVAVAVTTAVTGGITLVADRGNRTSAGQRS